MPKHIILILSDQHNPNVSGQHDSYVCTPNLDTLAEQGTSFSNCYCPSPLCVLSRIAMLTGQLPSKTGIITNQQALSSDTATFAYGLGIAGYETVLCGRMHFNGPDQRHGFQQSLVGDMTPMIVGGSDSNHSPTLTGTSGQSRVSVEKSGAGNSNVMVYDKAVRDAACQFIENWDGEQFSQIVRRVVVHYSLLKSWVQTRLNPVDMAGQSVKDIRSIVTTLVHDSGNPWLTGVCCINMDQNVSDEQITAIFQTVYGLREEYNDIKK
ncbi:hypothetical protein CSA56_02150 [candidate division KSB3 bacterium]|uniref:Sulfatase N-terminal domain-containing protein n=1 Tax=candidate division KSB3 bacterium TaxID=2044937 RepID=A0A2G6KJV9_9BACT|nr:MAG: hypothetical protein CSA56_02150 [candidate division KSB3 bacterium]